mgnify:FL=1
MGVPFKVKVITPDKTLFDGETEQIIVRSTEGDVGILANHISYVSSIPSSPLKIKQSDGTYKVAAISGGMIKTSKDKTTIIATAAEWADEIDIDWAKRSEEDARKRLKIHNGGLECERATLKLQRALNRISVAQMK